MSSALFVAADRMGHHVASTGEGYAASHHSATAGSPGVIQATVERVVRLGFEVRVELTNAATGVPFIAQITRGDAEALALAEGDTVYARATRVPPLSEVAPALT